jgi:hypothetical protein
MAIKAAEFVACRASVSVSHILMRHLRPSLWRISVGSNKDLTQEDKQLLAPKVNIEDLEKVLKSLEEKNKLKFTFRGKEIDVFGNIIKSVNKVKAIVDSAVSLDVSGHAALPWAGVKFILQVEYRRPLGPNGEIKKPY